MLVTTVYLHRHLTHRGVELRPEVRAASRVVLWITTALKPRQWARVHRQHHAAEDRPTDPHSPRSFGGGRAVPGTSSSTTAPSTPERHTTNGSPDKYRDLTADRWDRWFFDHGEMALQSASPCCPCAWRSSDTPSPADGSAPPSAQQPVSSRRIPCRQLPPPAAPSTASVTPAPPNYLTADMPATCPSSHGSPSGKVWHRNHHAAENSPRIGHRHQLDLGWLAIRGLCRARLAHITTAEPQDSNDCKRSPPRNISIGSLPRSTTRAHQRRNRRERFEPSRQQPSTSPAYVPCCART